MRAYRKNQFSGSQSVTNPARGKKNLSALMEERTETVTRRRRQMVYGERFVERLAPVTGAGKP